MWYTILITLVVDFGGLLVVYLLLRDRVRRATSVESRMSEIRDEVSRLLVELNQATDRNIALMEDKITALNEGISTADKKIGLLRRETEKHDVGSQIYSRLAEGRHARAELATPGRSVAEPPRAEAVLSETRAAQFASRRRLGHEHAGPAGDGDAESAEYRAAEGGFGAAEGGFGAAEANPPADAPGGIGDAHSGPLAVELSERAQSTAYRGGESTGYRGSESARSRGADGHDVRQRVMMLYRAGFSASLIASRVGAPVGEVELIISLEQRKGQA